MSLEKLERLSPTLETIDTSLSVEELSMKHLKSLLERGDIDKDDFAALSKVLNNIGQMRVNQRSEVSIKTKLFKSVSKDQDELKMYIEATFPKSLRR